MELNLYPVSCILKIPKYEIRDSIIYDEQTILSYDINSLDSVLDLNCFIKSYDKDPDAIFDINALMHFQKGEVEFGRDSIILLNETIEIIEQNKVGYLKYWVNSPLANFYETRIFFYTGRKLTVIWIFERKLSNKLLEGSISDCILKSIDFK